MTKQELIDKFREAMRAYDATGFDEALWDLMVEVQNEEGESNE